MKYKQICDCVETGRRVSAWLFALNGIGKSVVLPLCLCSQSALRTVLYIYPCGQRNGTSNLFNRTILFLVMFISFLFVAGKKRRNEPKKRKTRRRLTRTIFDGFQVVAFANSLCSDTLGDYYRM